MLESLSYTDDFRKRAGRVGVCPCGPLPGPRQRVGAGNPRFCTCLCPCLARVLCPGRTARDSPHGWSPKQDQVGRGQVCTTLFFSTYGFDT